MEFFITESQQKKTGSSCYFEFQKGQKNKEYSSVFWREDSLLLHADIADETELYKIIPDFNYSDITVISREKWAVIRQNAEREGGTLMKIIHEASDWAEENFKEFDYFVILGI